MLIREMQEKQEKETLSPYATLSAKSKGRTRPETPCPIRTIFQRDRDRIVHSKSFRRLIHKTQVFFAPKGDHYRTRLTHTLEVSQIARTIAKALRLNEDLTEAIALGHDLGHTPFGHAGEEVLNRIYPGGFSHEKQSLRVVDKLERDGQGLNLTQEVREGIIKHSKGRGEIFEDEDPPQTQEGMVVRIADLIAYLNHDLDDALRANVITTRDLPPEALKVIGPNYSERVNSMVSDIIYSTLRRGGEKISISEKMHEAMRNLRDFLYDNVYEAERFQTDFQKTSKVISELYQYFLKDKERFIQEAGPHSTEEGWERAVCDFIAGMTDRYALMLYEEMLLPRSWAIY